MQVQKIDYAAVAKKGYILPKIENASDSQKKITLLDQTTSIKPGKTYASYQKQASSIDVLTQQFDQIRQENENLKEQLRSNTQASQKNLAEKERQIKALKALQTESENKNRLQMSELKCKYQEEIAENERKSQEIYTLNEIIEKNRKIKKLETKTKLEELVQDFNKINQALNQCDSFEKKNEFSLCKENLTINSTKLNEINEEVESLFSRLEKKLESTKILRQEMIELWSGANHEKYKLDLKSTYLTRKFDLLPELNGILHSLTEQLQSAQDYYENSKTIVRGTLNYQVDHNQKEQYESDIAEKNKAFTTLHETIATYQNNLKTQMATFKAIPSVDESPKSFAKDNQKQADINLKFYTESRNSMEQNERQLYQTVVQKWNQVKNDHTKLSTYIAQLGGALEHPSLYLPWTYQVKLNESTILTYNPATTY